MRTTRPKQYYDVFSNSSRLGTIQHILAETPMQAVYKLMFIRGITGRVVKARAENSAVTVKSQINKHYFYNVLETKAEPYVYLITTTCEYANMFKYKIVYSKNLLGNWFTTELLQSKMSMISSYKLSLRELTEQFREQLIKLEGTVITDSNSREFMSKFLNEYCTWIKSKSSLG